MSVLKYYARILFGLQILVGVIVFLSLLWHELPYKMEKHVIVECVPELYFVVPMKSQPWSVLYMISTISQVPNLAAQYNFDTFLI